MSKLDKIYISLLNDYYGGLLTEYQSQLITLYYDKDLSLSEISNIYSTTRQAALNVVKRATKKLEFYEKNLQLVARISEIEGMINALINSKKQISEQDLIELKDKIRKI